MHNAWLGTKLLAVFIYSSYVTSISLDLSGGISLGPLSVQFQRSGPPEGYQLLPTSSLAHKLNSVLSGAGGDGDQTMDLKIGLTSSNIEGLEQALQQISDPTSPKYQKFLSDDEVQSFIAPSQKTKQALTSWLSSHNLTATPLTPAGEWVQISKIPVKKANTLLQATYQTFVHPATQATALRTLSYSLPEGLKGLVETVSPGASFDFGKPVLNPLQAIITPQKMVKSNKRPSPPPTSTAPPASCSTLVTPTCVQDLYGIPTSVSKPKRGSNNLLITGFIGEFAQEADLQAYLSILRPDLPSSTTFTLKTIDNGTNPQDPSKAGDEANLDIQISIGLVGVGVPVTFLSVGQTDQNQGLGSFQDAANFLFKIGRGQRPTVVSTSYGFNEPDLEPSAMRKLCNTYLALGALGTSIIYSSGDGGVSGNANTDCTDHGKFVPSFPSTCPYVTSVGGTTTSSTFPNGDRETALSVSSGGFSNVFNRPWYQTSQVLAYEHALGRNFTGLFNKNGRAFPDVSTIGMNIPIISGGNRIKMGGTSASAPIFASIIALLNNNLVGAGRPPLGFLNPWLYSKRLELANVFNDVKTGSNPGCNTTGFGAVKGWDAVTGLGSPKFASLEKLLGLRF